MKHWLLIMVLLPLTVSGSTITPIAGDKQDTIALDKSLSIFAEFSHKQSATKTEIILTIHGRVDEGFHVYSIHPQGDFAPDPTQLILESKILNLTGALKESKPQTIIDDAFRLPLKVHKNEFWLRQKCSIAKDVKQGLHNIRGYIQYQVCNNRICSLPLRKHFQEKVQID
jgi:hypothetical protein